jgi:hypothetical protein
MIGVSFKISDEEKESERRLPGIANCVEPANQTIDLVNHLHGHRMQDGVAWMEELVNFWPGDRIPNEEDRVEELMNQQPGGIILQVEGQELVG